MSTTTHLDAPIPNTYWVIPGSFLAGEYPRTPSLETSRIKLRTLLDAGMACFVDLTTPEDGLEPYVSLIQELDGKGVAYHRFPIPDVSVPEDTATMRRILDVIDGELARDRKVYVHCWGGIGRTGTVVGCWLARHHGREKALALLEARWRACSKSAERESPETAQQRQYIQLWQEPLDVQASNQSSRIP